jgi:hypothetical protein
MLTAKQIQSLPKGNYPNWRLQQLFPKQQGSGRSSRVMMVEKTDGQGKKIKVPFLQSFFKR